MLNSDHDRLRIAGKSVLVIEDDYKTASLISLYLSNEGARVVIAGDGKTGLELAKTLQPTLIVLDMMLPGMDGMSVCHEIRKKSDVPIIFLSARGEEDDRVGGLNEGADDYMTKPFSLKELAARANSILRRTPSTKENQHNHVCLGSIKIDKNSMRCFISDKEVSLTRSEFLLLEKLLSSPDRVFSRDSLINTLYPAGNPVVDRVVDVHIGKLRKKFNAPNQKSPKIETVRGIGYRIAV
ncbi:MAG: response regulator transcription factor [Pseudomonadota bacterium]